MPLPVPKPNIPEVEVKQSKVKQVGKRDDETRGRTLRRQVGPVRWRPGS
jgi:hypothetical protein